MENERLSVMEELHRVFYASGMLYKALSEKAGLSYGTVYTALSPSYRKTPMFKTFLKLVRSLGYSVVAVGEPGSLAGAGVVAQDEDILPFLRNYYRMRYSGPERFSESTGIDKNIYASMVYKGRYHRPLLLTVDRLANAAGLKLALIKRKEETDG